MLQIFETSKKELKIFIEFFLYNFYKFKFQKIILNVSSLFNNSKNLLTSSDKTINETLELKILFLNERDLITASVDGGEDDLDWQTNG